MNWKKLFSLISVGVFLLTMVKIPTPAQDLEEFREERQQGMEKIEENRQRAIEERIEEREEYFQERKKAFEKFREERAKQWGEQNVRMPDQTNYVSYDENGDQRHSVDFKEGEASVEAVVDTDVSEEEAKNQLTEQIVDLISDTGQDILEDQVDEPEDAAQPEESEDKPLLEGQLKTDEGETVTEKNADEFAEEIVAEENIQKDTAETEKGEQSLVGIDISLVPDHLKERVEKHKKQILNFASEHNLKPSLIFSIAHTESHFNPRARSHIPAYGLMQIVPETAGKDAYKYLYGKERLLSADYLYQPKNNIELGAAYFEKLMNVYLDSIDNKLNREYCAIAAYNIGPGGMARTFVDKTNIQDAARVINTLQPEEVYQRLRNDLPAKETRKYMKKITANREHYQQWDQ